MKIDENSSYKPLNKKSKFLKPNEQGQIANDCIDFGHIGKYGSCQFYEDWQDVIHPCEVAKGCYCKNYNNGSFTPQNQTC